MSEQVTRLAAAESPFKQVMLKGLEALRAEIEAGEVIALVMLPVHPGLEWSTRTCGNINMLQLAGMMAVAQAQAVERCRAGE